MADSITSSDSSEISSGAPRDIGPPRESGGPMLVVWFVVFASVTALAVFLFCRKEGWGAGLGLAPAWAVVIGVVFSLLMGWLCLFVAFRAGRCPLVLSSSNQTPVHPSEYQSAGLGPVSADEPPGALYLDMVKRSVANILYQDTPLAFYDHHQQPMLAPGFDLTRRVMGEDIPTNAHTMVGLRRLDNIQMCIERALQDDVPGDLVEAGVFRGGAAIFMRAVLRAHNVTDRRVFACDTFTPIAPGKPNWLIVPIMQGIGAIPFRWWRRNCVVRLQSYVAQSSFPPCENPSDGLVDFVMWHLRNPAAIPPAGGTSLDSVRSRFAKYGLLDDQVVFLEGFFSDTLPGAPLERAAVIRLDGDTYESTRDAISLLYPKLSSGGYCIIDDYNSYQDCKRSVHDYRDAHDISEPIEPIDNMAVYWRKS